MWNPLADYIKEHPRVIKDSWLGQLTDKVLRLQPNEYDTSKYPQRLQKSHNRPIRIVFSGMHDNQDNRYAQEALKKRYGQSTIYVFGYDQYKQALQFASGLDKSLPVTVYGYSWGGGDAQKFLNNYKGNIIGAHFMDPVRKDLDQQKQMKVPKRIPVTFTKAMPFQPGLLNDIKEATIGNLRYAPAKNFHLLPTAKSHGSVDEWVTKVYNYQKQKKKLQKAASLSDYVRQHAIDIQNSPLGRLILGVANALPANYSTSSYKEQLWKQDQEGSPKPVKIFFSGLPDSQFVGFAKKAMQKKYGPDSVFVFGHKQLPQALEFASNLDPKRPVTVYGFSWGSTAARDFADLYGGNLVGVHFLDPMRKAPSVDPLLTLKKREVPVTFTAAVNHDRNQLSSAVLDSLRWKPSRKFTVLPNVADHLDIDDWLDRIPKTASWRAR